MFFFSSIFLHFSLAFFVWFGFGVRLTSGIVERPAQLMAKQYLIFFSFFLSHFCFASLLNYRHVFAIHHPPLWSEFICDFSLSSLVHLMREDSLRVSLLLVGHSPATYCAS